jgi:hypothetical protein
MAPAGRLICSGIAKSSMVPESSIKLAYQSINQTSFGLMGGRLFSSACNDGSIFADTLAGLLVEDEGVEVNQGYQGHPKFNNPSLNLSYVH